MADMAAGLHELVEASARVSATPRRLDKIAAIARLLQGVAGDEIALAVSYLSGETRQSRLGVGPAAILSARPGHAAPAASLRLSDVDRVLQEVSATSGAGSGAQRRQLLHALLARATLAEQDFLVRLLVGELRQGALEGLMQEAIARAAGVPLSEVRRAAMVAGGLAPVASAALVAGVPGLHRFSLRLFQPLLPMLAQPAEDVADAMGQLDTAALDWKLDGARVQVHKDGDEVRVYSRSLNDVTAAVPEVVEAVRAIRAPALILDGETIALAPDGAPQPFQVTMRRFGRRLGVDDARATLPLSVFFFDVLHREGDDLLDRPARERFATLESAVPAPLRVPRLITADPQAAQQFLDDALRHGHEGIMAKSLDAPYEAGGRGSSWLKIKQAHTLDLVILAAEWGHGRRRGTLSNLHLGARDPAGGGFVMLGKTFKGLTDEMLAWQTTALLEREVARDANTVYVRPELVVEIAVSDIQESPRYPAGMALRLARVKRYRTDKSAVEADTVVTVRALFERRPTAPGS
jgi:DNA ligase-1